MLTYIFYPFIIIIILQIFITCYNVLKNMTVKCVKKLKGKMLKMLILYGKNVELNLSCILCIYIIFLPMS